jgi:hypothetical protein
MILYNSELDTKNSFRKALRLIELLLNYSLAMIKNRELSPK